MRHGSLQRIFSVRIQDHGKGHRCCVFGRFVSFDHQTQTYHLGHNADHLDCLVAVCPVLEEADDGTGDAEGEGQCVAVVDPVLVVPGLCDVDV